jgi:transcription-repair coupling factor
MKLTNLPFQLKLKEPLRVLEKTGQLTFVNLANSTAKSFLISEIVKNSQFNNVIWASTEERADSIHAVANLMIDGNNLIVPSNIMPRDLYKLRKLLVQNDSTILLFEDINYILAQHFPSFESLEKEKINLKVGTKIQIFQIFEKLEELGYSPALDNILQPGEFVRRGENLFIFPANSEECMRIELYDDLIEKIESIEQQYSSNIEGFQELDIYPQKFTEFETVGFFDLFPQASDTLFISDDLDEEVKIPKNFPILKFTTFPKEEENFFHLNFFSVLPFYTIPDFVVDIKERLRREFEIVVLTKKFDQIENIFAENEIMWTEDLSEKMISTVKIKKLESRDFMPHSFQNNDRKLILLTDREIFQFRRTSRQKKAISGMNTDLILSLKPGNHVVHTDHGIALFEGTQRRHISEEQGEREYLKLGYAQNDKLFIPVESAEKLTKYIGEENPKLTRLGAADWKKTQSKLKEEAEKIAKDLLKLYAARELAKGNKFAGNDEMMKEFEDSFPYELTPGQAQTWQEIRLDMESPRPMDRLVCGDVGFGKTEMAMRASFKAFRSGMQSVILAPITILAEQHYESFMKRIAGKSYGVNIALLSRFQSKAEQTKIVKDLEFGLVDILIGTHRVLSDDIKFKNLGIVIIDEEQRFGVKQKEKLKKLAKGADLLTMTATPIPRTLNMSLNKLKDISTITTPPPGRLPVITEVRKYNLNLIRERILFEKERGGQVYFLHNQVQSIEGLSNQLKSLMPEIKFIVAHGQLKPEELEQRIKKFKTGEIDVLIASTIIENGIDLANANTLIVNRAEKFGLSQLYQLRGRVGRSRTQSYAFFLHHGQKLELSAKKRLRAIVEANELGSGFQIAMRDLEIRGAGEILGASQSGTIKTVGMSHFIRMLNKTVEDMKRGEISTEIEEEVNISVEVPLSAYIPTEFIPDENERIRTYQELAGSNNEKELREFMLELREDFGTVPTEVENLAKVIRLKMLSREAHLEGVKINKSSHRNYELVLRMGKKFSPEQIFGLIQNSVKKWVITNNAIKLKFDQLHLDWYDGLVKDIGFLILENRKKKNLTKN